MAICIAGDFDPDAAIKLIDKNFSLLKPKALPVFTPAEEEPIAKPLVIKVKGPEAEELVLGYRFNGINSPDTDYLALIDKMLFNKTAGLIDLNLNRQQKVLDASSSLESMKDYSVHIISAKPRKGQTLDQVRTLLLEQLELLKEGSFPDWLMDAAINDIKIGQQKLDEGSQGRVEAYVSAYTSGMEWLQYVSRFERLQKITKIELVAFARKQYGSNYVVVYKENGKAVSEAVLLSCATF